MRTTLRSALAVGWVLASACAGQIEPREPAAAGAPGAPTGPMASPPMSGGDTVGKVGLRRLSRDELDNTLRDLLGDGTRPATRFLPEDKLVPFDNDYTTQAASGVLVEALESLAADVARRLLADPARRDAVVGCRPAGPADAACLRKFVTTFGRRAIRRPLAPNEIDDFVRAAEPLARRAGDFYAGVDVVLRTMLQDGELVYRAETGAPVSGSAGLFKLDPWQVATRLAYTLWGSTPPDTLLDLAAAGRLSSAAGVREAAAMLIADRRAADRLDRFFALWLGYAQLPHPALLTTAMRRETAALVKRVLVDRQPWTDLFLAKETFIDDTLAAHYGLPRPGAAGPTWVSYGQSGRQGLLSHGSFLSAAGNFTDTSPTRRGKLIRTQLFCQSIPDPPPTVKADEPPKTDTSPCKWDRYEDHRSDPSCSGCHKQMDPIGFGLENYDNAGRFRTTDPGLPQCPIKGDGELVGTGAFHGPAELGNLLVADDTRYGPCIARQLYRFVMGREALPEDAGALADLGRRFKAAQHRLADIVLELVATEAFGYRREE